MTIFWGYRITRQRERYIRSMLNKLAQKVLILLSYSYNFLQFKYQHYSTDGVKKKR